MDSRPARKANVRALLRGTAARDDTATDRAVDARGNGLPGVSDGTAVPVAFSPRSGTRAVLG